MRLTRGVCLALGAVLGCAACAGSQPAEDSSDQAVRQDELPGRAARTQAPEESRATTEHPATTPSADAGPPETSEATEGADSSGNDEYERPGAADVAFLMPSLNVVCAMRAEVVACEIFEREYVPDADPAVGERADACDPADADMVILSAGSTPFWDCALDPLLPYAALAMAGSWATSQSEQVVIAGQDYALLPYGSERAVGEMTCRSDNGGVQCTDAAGHGFRLARSSYELY